MNLYRLKTKSYKYLYIQWYVLAGVMLIFSFIIRNDILKTANVNNISVNQWDFLLTYISEQKIMLFLILPHFIINTINLIFSQYNLVVLLRMSGWLRFIKYILYRNRFNIFGYILLVVLTSLIWLPSFSIEQEWSNFMGPESLFVNDVIKSLSTMNITPLSAYIIQLFIFTMFLVMVSIIFIMLIILTNNRQHVYRFGIGMNLFLIVTWILAKRLPLLHVLKYLYLYQTIKQPFYIILTLIGIIILNFFVAKNIKYKNFGYQKKLQR